MRRAVRQAYDRDLDCAYRGDNRYHHNSPGHRKWGKRILAVRVRRERDREAASFRTMANEYRFDNSYRVDE